MKSMRELAKIPKGVTVGPVCIKRRIRAQLPGWMKPTPKGNLYHRLMWLCINMRFKRTQARKAAA